MASLLDTVLFRRIAQANLARERSDAASDKISALAAGALQERQAKTDAAKKLAMVKGEHALQLGETGLGLSPEEEANPSLREAALLAQRGMGGDLRAALEKLESERASRLERESAQQRSAESIAGARDAASIERAKIMARALAERITQTAGGKILPAQTADTAVLHEARQMFVDAQRSEQALLGLERNRWTEEYRQKVLEAQEKSAKTEKQLRAMAERYATKWGGAMLEQVLKPFEETGISETTPEPDEPLGPLSE